MKNPELVLLLPIGILVVAFALRIALTPLANMLRDRRLRRAADRIFNDRDDDPPLAI